MKNKPVHVDMQRFKTAVVDLIYDYLLYCMLMKRVLEIPQPLCYVLFMLLFYSSAISFNDLEKEKYTRRLWA